jgi:ribonucleotide reductase alpha subunit
MYSSGCKSRGRSSCTPCVAILACNQVEERLRSRRGEFYQSVEKEVAARFAKEQALKEYDLEAYRKQLQAKLETEYDNKFGQVEAAFEQKVSIHHKNE